MEPTDVKLNTEGLKNDNGTDAFEVAFEKDDPEDPQAWSSRKKWAVLSLALFITFTSTFNSAAQGAAFSSILATRFFQGIGGSVEGPVVAGIVADLFVKKNRGTAMGTFVVMVYAGNGLGPTCSNWISFKVNWHWVYWLQMIMGGVQFLLVLCFLPETRGSLILEKRAAARTKETGREHYISGTDHLELMTFRERIKISLTRPLLYLFTEPIVTIMALWIGTAWGVVFLYIGAVAHVFTKVYGFNQGQASSVLVCGLIGAILGWFTNQFVQERLYRNAVAKGQGRAAPEVRLYSSAAGGIAFSVGAFGFAWTARPWIHWIAPCIFITLSNMGLYTVYLATYNYLSDIYGTYSSSAQAAQSLLRGVLGACFPFFGIIMASEVP
ncbi:hypothetical protein RQP46_007916 [Phenoliferia psychrophenolica]